MTTPLHHSQTGYRNPHLSAFKKSLWQVFKMRWTSQWANHRSLAHEVKRCQPDYARIATPTQELQLTWIGHSTFLIQVNGINILTDPVFSERVSPFSFAGPRRYTPPAMNIDELPPIDYAVISHNHYDHLDLDSVKAIGNDCLWVLPKDNEKYLHKEGITNTIELDWWASHCVDELTFTATPAQHWSARGLNDRCEALWCGWVLKTKQHRVYFAGDTGYNDTDFNEIGRRLGPFDVSLIPIGAYEPRWFMKDMHINPSEAVQIHKDVCSKQSFAMHWGTFPLTAEPPGAPATELALALERSAIDQSQFCTLQIGETRPMD
ncbi:MAG: MBL fold metallo-hydrolase [Bradymonadia bacterium]